MNIGSESDRIYFFNTHTAIECANILAQADFNEKLDLTIYKRGGREYRTDNQIRSSLI
jgi:hypothetical protein